MKRVPKKIISIVKSRLTKKNKDENYSFKETDIYFKVLEPNTPIFDNRSGKLIKVGSLEKGQIFPRVSDYGNWHKVQFNDFYGYIHKSKTEPVYKKVKFYNNQDQHSSGYFLNYSKVKVYHSNGQNMGMLAPQAKYSIASELTDRWEISFLNSQGYINKNDVLFYAEDDVRQVAKRYVHKNKEAALNRISPFLVKYSTNYTSAANSILNSQLNIKGYELINISKGIPWGQNEDSGKVYSRSFYRVVHGHYFINDLIAAYRESKNNTYIHKGFEILKDWIEQNAYNNTQNPMAWHDETTSRRFKTWVSFYDVARDVLDEESLVFFLRNLFKHADLLSTDEFHTKNTNHGMFQDESLLVFCDYFDDLAKHNYYYFTATKRLKDYFNFIISKEGVHLEHSPIYHFIIARMIRKLARFFQKNGNNEAYSYYWSLYEKMALYSTFIIKPDGILPGIGDTFKGLRGYNDLWQDNEHYVYTLTTGKKGIPPKETAVNFQDAGYAIIRDNWELGSDATYIHFTAAYHTAYHKHSDDLSVWLYANGQDIVTEAGANGYDYKEPFTKFGYSSFAHNTLIVNNKGLPRVDNKFDHTHLFTFEEKNNITKVSGINRRYGGVSHERELSYNKKNRELKVIDKVDSKSKNNYKILWHLAENIVPEMIGNRINLMLDNKEIATLDIESTSSFKVSIVIGQTEPDILGWQIKKKNNPVKTYTIIIEAVDSSTKIESLFQII